MDEQANFEPQAVLTRRRAGRNRLLILVPVLAFAAVGWAGLSGAGADSQGAAAAATQPAASGSQVGWAPATLPVANVAPGPEIAVPLWPEQVLGIDVRSARGLRPFELVDGAEIAVAGFYEAGAVSGCPPEVDVELPDDLAELGVVSDTDTFCERSGRLFATSPDASTSGTYRLENRFKSDDLPALSVAMRPGVVVPPKLVRSGGDAPTPMVLIGRFVWPFDGCAKFVTRCRPQLLVDRVIWVGGVGHAQTTSILPRLLDPGPLLSSRLRDRLAEATLGPSGAILMETLVDLPTLAAMDPDAAAAVIAASPEAQRIWYRRALGDDPARDDPRWIAIDDATGQVIAAE